MNRKPLAFTSIPAWTMPAAAGALSFFETIALAGLEGQWVRLSAADQRAILGSNVFGKQAFRVKPEGDVEVMRKTAFGMDSEIASYDLYEVKRAIERRLRVSPGVSGGGYLDLGAERLIDTVRVAGRDDEAKALAANGKWHELDRMLAGLTGRGMTNWPSMRRAAAILLAA